MEMGKHCLCYMVMLTAYMVVWATWKDKGSRLVQVPRSMAAATWAQASYPSKVSYYERWAAWPSLVVYKAHSVSKGTPAMTASGFRWY